MVPHKFYPGRDIEDPRERVIQTAMFLLQLTKRVPTQDAVVEALRLPATDKQPATSTGKQTVNKYWGDFQQQLAEDLDFAGRLPPEIPNFAIDYLRKLMEYAQKHADSTVKDKQAILARQEERLRERQAKMDADYEALETKALALDTRVREVEGQLAVKTEQLSERSAERDQLKHDLRQSETARIEAETELSHAREQTAQLALKYDAVAHDLRQSEQALKTAQSDRQRYEAANNTMAMQVRELQVRVEEQTQRADERLVELQELRMDKGRLTDKLNEALDRQHPIELKFSLLERDKVNLERQVQSLTDQLMEQRQVIEHLSRGFQLEVEQDGVVQTSPLISNPEKKKE